MSWVLALAGFAALIVLHELGHFTVAKAVGMRVERFALFFPPLLFKVRRGETEYGIGAIPLGGYVKISGMNPQELDAMDPTIRHRAYYLQAPWKRVAVILAGPLANVIIAFLIFWVLILSGSSGAAESLGTVVPTAKIAEVEAGQAATGVLRAGDTILAVDGVRGSLTRLSDQIAGHACAGAPKAACRAATPARITVARAGGEQTFALAPRYDAHAKRMRLGFGFGGRVPSIGPIDAAGISLDRMWSIVTGTLSREVSAVYTPAVRHQLTSVVGLTTVTHQAFAFDTAQAIVLLGFISLALAIVNLFPFLPLDGGHILWSVAEKVRGRRISLMAMARYSSVGCLLLVFLVFSAISNDIGKLTGSGFH
ncbi:MAG: regulator of sigma protease [Solirubrobacteraceae bacterium]|nr:regulator of sigma protease [Solirubrobacteraceae bacterium]